MRLLILSSLFLFLTQNLGAEETIRYYDIELVVFENLAETTDNNEIWPKGKQLVAPENAATLGQKYAGSLPVAYNPKYLFKILPLEDYKLKDEAETLTESEKYRVLLHTGWRQPGMAKEVAIPVHFSHVIAESAEETPAAEEDKTVATTAPVVAQVPAGLANLQGVITIVLSRYLHLDVEMLYQKESEDKTVDMFDTSFLEDRSDKEPIYYMKQNRRMRSQETHYIDHPKFSLLVRITPLAEETPVEPAPAAAPKG